MLRKIIKMFFRPLIIEIVHVKKRKTCCQCSITDNKVIRYYNEKMLRISIYNNKLILYLCMKHAKKLRQYIMSMNLVEDDINGI